MKGRRNPFVAREGLPFLIVSLVIAGIGWRLGELPYAAPGLLLFAWLFLVFRDPHRVIPASPLGVVSPVDGVVQKVGLSDNGVVDDEVHTLLLRVSSLGAYSARSPVEGKIMDLQGDTSKDIPDAALRGLWLHTDEGDDVVLQFHGYRFGLAPLAMLRFGERIGQGQRCAYLRLTRYAELQLPLAARVLVKEGQRVKAGRDLLARLPHH